MKERFKMPIDKQLIEICILFNKGKVDVKKLGEQLSVLNFVLDRLYENGDILKKSSKEQ